MDTVKTVSTWSAPLQGPDFTNFIREKILEMYNEGKTADGYSAENGVQGPTEWVYIRHWVNADAAQEWKDFVKTYPGWISTEILPL